MPEGLQLYYKETPTQVFPCEFCEVFKNAYFEEHLRRTASESYLKNSVSIQIRKKGILTKDRLEKIKSQTSGTSSDSE